jgi:UDP-N-acetylmuramate--alanine ligase
MPTTPSRSTNADMPHITPGQHIHLVGIGGAGLSAIARILLGQGYIVSGSDRTLNALTDALQRDGAIIFAGHDAAYVTRADALIVSSAIQPDQVEIAAALAAGIPVYKRSNIMADLMVGKKVIAVAGTAGKTTTTAMITPILIETRQDPSYIIGGVLSTTGTNAAVGKGDAFVIEADEYDNMFLGLRPNIAVITNFEWDHPDFFKTPKDMLNSFERFVGLLPDDGILIACADDWGARLVAEHWQEHRDSVAALYGIDRADVMVSAVDVRPDGEGNSFIVTLPDESIAAEVATLRVPGRHNILNALGAITATLNDVSLEAAVKAISTFKGTARRFELKGEIEGTAVIDDYAHNPAKIRAALEATRSRYPDRRIWAVWQPHTYSRTQALMSDFLAAFKDADHVLITEIYAAREQPIEGVNAADLAAQMDHPDARFVATFDAVFDRLVAEVQAPAAIIVMSAGDATQISAEYLRKKGKA